MRLTPLYLKYKSGELTIERYAEKVGTTPRALKIRLTKHGKAIKTRFEILDKISDNLITRAEAAAKWGNVDVRTINAAMKQWGVERPITESMISRAAPEVKNEVSLKYTLDFIKGSLDLTKSAEAANMSERNLRRWVSKLLKKHLDMPYGDLKHVSQPRREALANDMMRMEKMEAEKQKEMLPVLAGKISRFEEAEVRVAAKRAARKAAKLRKPSKPLKKAAAPRAKVKP